MEHVIRCKFFPTEFLHSVASSSSGSQVHEAVNKTIQIDDELKANGLRVILSNLQGSQGQLASGSLPPNSSQPTLFSVYDANYSQSLPGQLIPESSPNRIAKIVRYRLKMINGFFQDVFQHTPFPQISATINYDRDYVNAFYDPAANLFVFGSGNTHTARELTDAYDVMTHELTHGIIAVTSKLDSNGEPGALDEHLADVFGVLFRQHWRGSLRTDHEWCIGADTFHERAQDGVVSSAPHPSNPNTGFQMGEPGDTSSPGYLRSLENPQSSVPPQPSNMANYDLQNDEPHINSGIPNFAFYTAATKAGGNAWEGVGQVWHKTMMGGELTQNCTFLEFAQLTIKNATGCFETLEKPIRQGWAAAGIQC